ncbi:unnamed protein product [Darwinula stevensoni]|uniref:Uncharacterized protein n=1 Tax=Darwinula stevensoni TaxID=69355 RepID=A0A7R9AG82_9CRUS|nr:unnamed protein product [Darwinula stevensoni]CAG0903579.1 unnamed protein product [Darwinula stevensoni]
MRGLAYFCILGFLGLLLLIIIVAGEGPVELKKGNVTLEPRPFQMPMPMARPMARPLPLLPFFFQSSQAGDFTPAAPRAAETGTGLLSLLSPITWVTLILGGVFGAALLPWIQTLLPGIPGLLAGIPLGRSDAVNYTLANATARAENSTAGFGLPSFDPARMLSDSRTLDFANLALGAVMGDKECLKRAFCESGRFLKPIPAKNILFLLMRLLGPQWSDGIEIARGSALELDQKGCEDQFKCFVGPLFG